MAQGCWDHASIDLAQQLMQAAVTETDTMGAPQAFHSAAKQDEVQPWAGSPNINQGRELCGRQIWYSKCYNFACMYEQNYCPRRL